MKILRRGLTSIVLVLAALLGGGEDVAASMTVLVTNDDSVGAAGIDTLVSELKNNPELNVVVIAPERDQSGTGEQRIVPPGVITVRSAATRSGFPAKAVAVFPADSVLFGVLQELADDPPELLVSGINSGPNMTAEIISLSGTVGAASWGARLGIPAFAVSASFSSPDFARAAQFIARLVEHFRLTPDFQSKMREKAAPFRGVVLNINWPTCTEGDTLRGARIVAVGRLLKPSGYTPAAPAPVTDTAGVQIWQAQGDIPDPETLGKLQESNCDPDSMVNAPVTDIEAWNNGFVGIAPLDAERSASGRTLEDFSFVEGFF